MRFRLMVFYAVVTVFFAGTWWTCARSGLAGAEPAEKQAENPPAAEEKSTPKEKSNCVNCHMKAGRELTEAVHLFAGSIHDLNSLSCNDCHGGNTENDEKAHEPQFGFIGTKLSAHVKKCGECHTDEAAALAAGPHFFDHDKRLNTEFPLCIDCHGNHDVGSAPAEFSLKLVCLDCHKDLDAKFAALSGVTDANDKLWDALRGYRQKRKADDPVRNPKQVDEELAKLRTRTATLMHSAKQPSEADAKALERETRALTEKIKKLTVQ